MTWFTCALICSGDLGRLARIGINQGLFWINVGLNFNPMGMTERQAYAGAFVLGVLRHATPQSFSYIPVFGFSTLSRTIQVGALFFRASLYDLAFGTNTLGALDPPKGDGLSGGCIGVDVVSCIHGLDPDFTE